jgi:hypothetical protein
MIQEAIKKYRGVLCLHCRQPIPLPAAVTRRVAEGGEKGQDFFSEMGPRVFTLRCRACHGEGLYAESKFVDCEGTPRTRFMASRKASPMLPDGLTRAANG